MRKLLFISAAVLAVCVVVAAAEELSELARQKLGIVEKEVRKRVESEPLTFTELCSVELARLEEEGKGEEEREKPDPLKSLYHLRYALRKRIADLNPYWKPKGRIERKYKYLHKVYDIADLVTRPPDRPAPMIGFGYGPHLDHSTTRTSPGGGGIIDLGDSDDDSTSPGFDWEKIEELLERLLPRDYGQNRSIYYTGGKLVCYVTAEDAKQIEELLHQLRQTTGYAVNLEVKFIRASAEYLRELRHGKGGDAIYLSDEAEKKLLDDVAQEKGVEVLASSEVIAADSQVVHIREGQQVSLLMDYDINTVGIPTLQPVVKLVNEGLICQFIPVVLKDGKEVNINVLATLSKIRRPIRKGDFLSGELMFAAMDMSRLRTNVQVPSGKAVLAGGTALMPGVYKKDSHEFVVYIKPTISQRKK